MSPRSKGSGSVVLEKMELPSEKTAPKKSPGRKRASSVSKVTQRAISKTSGVQKLEKMEPPTKAKSRPTRTTREVELEKIETPAKTTRKRATSSDKKAAPVLEKMEPPTVSAPKKRGRPRKTVSKEAMELPAPKKEVLERVVPNEDNAEKLPSLRKMQNTLEVMRGEIADQDSPDFEELSEKIEEVAELLEKQNEPGIDLEQFDIPEMQEYIGTVGSIQLKDDQEEANPSEVNCVFTGILDEEYLPGYGYQDDDDIIVTYLRDDEGSWELYTTPFSEIAWFKIFPNRGEAQIFVTW